MLRVGISALLQLGYLALLARLLERSDFGEVAIVMAVLTISDLFSQTGMDAALMRYQGRVEDLLHPAWSCQVVRGAFLALIVFLLGPPATLLEGMERVGQLLMVAAAVPLIDGFHSKSLVILGRRLHQGRITLGEIATTVIGIASGTLLVYWARSPWALVVNMLVFAALRTGMSYLVHPYRPRFTLRWGPLRPFLRYGFFYNLAGGAECLAASADKFIIGRLLGLDLLGLYDRCFALSNYGALQLPKLLAATAFPSLASVMSTPERFARLVRRYLRLVVVLFATGGTALVLLADPLVRTIIGAKFVEGIPLFRVLACGFACRGVAAGLQIIPELYGRSHLRFVANLIQLLVLVAAVPGGIAAGGLLGAGIGVALANAAGLAANAWFVAGILRADRARVAPETPLAESPAPGGDAGTGRREPAPAETR